MYALPNPSFLGLSITLILFLCINDKSCTSSDVPSGELSSTTKTSKSIGKEIIELIILAILSASLYVGITTIELRILKHKSKDLSNNRINPQNISNFEK